MMPGPHSRHMRIPWFLLPPQSGRLSDSCLYPLAGKPAPGSPERLPPDRFARIRPGKR